MEVRAKKNNGKLVKFVTEFFLNWSYTKTVKQIKEAPRNDDVIVQGDE